MNLLETVLSVLDSIGIIAANPVLGGVGVVTKIAPLIGLLSSLAAEGVGAQTKLTELDKELKALVAAGRVPSEAEWQDWNARHLAAHARLQA